MANFFNTPLFGLTLSVLAYTIGLLIYRRFPNPLTTPLLVSTALIIVICTIQVFPTRITM